MVVGKLAVVAGAAAAAAVLAAAGAVGVRFYRAKKRAKEKRSTGIQVLTDTPRSDAEKFESKESGRLLSGAGEARLALVPPKETSGSPLTSVAGVGEQPSPATTDVERELASEGIDRQSLHCDFGEVPSATTRATGGAERKQSQDGRDDVLNEASAAGDTSASGDCHCGIPEIVAANVADEDSIAVQSPHIGPELHSHEDATNVECGEKVVAEKPSPTQESLTEAVPLFSTAAGSAPLMSTISGDNARLPACGLLELPALAKNHQLSPTAAPFYPSRHATPCIKHSLSPFAAPFYPPSHVRAFDS